MSRWYQALAGWVRGRSRRDRIGIAAVLVVLVVGVAALLVAGGGDGGGLWRDGSTAAAPADDTAADTGGGPAPDPGGDQPQPAGAASAPPPYIHEFADQPNAKPRAVGPSPTAGVTIPEGTDGCDHAYGDRDVCVPWQFPSGVTDKCAWLRDRGFKQLKITGGRDRHGLDRDGDGIACGPND
ncbi:hypothetical protein AB0J74_03410 [Asanoa sp. NPDC049573]|uniref:hypothetical protein n=1 Tax=Asanoa sp. NPDC049573 TaxID=3155396 RepID=UPI00343CE092